jgi:hypothetical protein
MSATTPTNPSVYGGSYGSWPTAAELSFLAGLGRWSPIFLGRRRDLVRGYLAGLELRTDWGHIDRGVVKRAAEAELAREERRLPR